MERKLYRRVYRLVVAACQRLERSRHATPSIPDRWIVLVYLWAVIHDRPVSWACRRAHWPADLAPMRLPSQPTMSRRLRTGRVLWAMALVRDRLRGTRPRGLVKCLDAKPLPVGGCSKDRSARWGYGGRAHFRGYKLHALWGPGRLPLAWEVRPANASESTEADRLLVHLRGGGYVDADAAYDCNRLYDLAWEHGHQLIAPPKKPDHGGGHREQGVHRVRGQELLGCAFGKAVYAARIAVEQDFGRLVGCGGGLAGLPAWVRGPGRVGMWVEAKLLLNAIRPRLPGRLAA
jgi:hypothetical protein